MIIDQGNTFLCASYCFSYALYDKFKIKLDVNWLPGMRETPNAMLDSHLKVLEAHGALPESKYSIAPCAVRQDAQDWVNKNKSKLLKLAAPYKVKEWKKVSSSEELRDLLSKNWYAVFIAKQCHEDRLIDGWYYPYDGIGSNGTHAMSVWLKDNNLWVQNTRGEDWGIKGGAFIRDEDVIKGKQCYAFCF